MVTHIIGTCQAFRRRPPGPAAAWAAVLAALLMPAAWAAPLELVQPGAACRYLVPTNNTLGLTWTHESGFSDAGWTAGAGGLGYEAATGPFSNLIQTTLPVTVPSAFIRWPFALTNTLAFDTLTLRMQYDDGFVAYLNGELIATANAPEVPLYNSMATADHPDASSVQVESFDATAFKDLLHVGTNILAVQVFNQNLNPRIANLLVRAGLETSAYEALGGAGIVINELHANPENPAQLLQYVELHNPGTTEVALAGWSFSAGIAYQFGAGVFLPPNGYLVVAENPAALSNRFHVAAQGPFLGLLKAGGENVVLRNGLGEKVNEVTYGAGFPWPTVGDAPGNSMQLLNPALDNNLGGSWRSGTPTPAASNVVLTAAALVPPQIRQVAHTPAQPASGAVVTITAKITDADGVALVTLHHQAVDPGAYLARTDAAYSNTWTNVTMRDDGTSGDALAGDAIYTVRLPASLHTHRRLLRYRITAADIRGNAVRVPYADDPQPNFAYFVYNGVPAWTAAAQPGVTAPVTYGAEVMGRHPAYHLIAKKADVVAATWSSKYTGELYPWTGALVVDGKVYDHIGFRARGGMWRYAMGKNMWKFSFNRGHYLEARDDYGNRYGEPRDNLNLSACIQQADTQHRGEQGMFEAVGFRLFNLAGLNASRTHWLSLRVVDDASETGATQYDGDFWGLYLAIEQLDGNFLDDHSLPDGNLYKWEGSALPGHQGHYSVTNMSDVNTFANGLNGATLPTEAWWRLNVNLDAYYSYRTIIDAIHHYDLGYKNWYYYFDPTPVTNAFGVAPLTTIMAWDLDLTWANSMYYGGDDPFRPRGALNFSDTAIEYRNRVRELRDLLFNTNETWRLINEYAAIVAPSNALSILAADRAQWDYNPVMTNTAYVNLSKAGQGHFYEKPPTHDFAGIVKIMRDYVVTRGVGTLDPAAIDSSIPATPTASPVTNRFAVNDLSFRCSTFSDPQGSSTFAAMRWRLGEVTDTNAPAYDPTAPGRYEIEAVWDSGILTNFSDRITLPNDVAKVGHAYRLRVKMKDNTGRWSHWSEPVAFIAAETDNAAALAAHLRVTELLADPPDGSAYEFIELFNTSSNLTLDLDGARFTAGITFVFPAGTLMPPQSARLVVQAPSAGDYSTFRARYGLGMSVPISGPYTGSLNNGGETLTLKASAAGTTLFTATYSDGRGWPLAAVGAGHSLVPLIQDSQADGALDYGGNWRASTYLGGSPGAPDPNPIRDALLNEIIAHTDYTNPAMPEYDSNDAIELYNPTGHPLVLTNWFLSDDAADLRKWAIPAGTTLPANGWKLFDEVTGFHHPITAGFGLNKAGEQIFLSHLPGTTNDRIADAVAFKGQENFISWGRYPDGDPWWRALAPPTPNAANAAPLASVVFDELLYHPAPTTTHPDDNTNDEYIELHNPTATAIPLANTEVGPWRLNGGVSYYFPTGTVLAAGERLAITSFDPVAAPASLQAFTNAHRLTNGTPRILGPYVGKLANGTDRIALERGVAPDLPGDPVSWAILDEVAYADQRPWPTAADGTGIPLQRRSKVRSANDPANWSAAYTATPGLSAIPATNQAPYTLWMLGQFGAEGIPGTAPAEDFDSDGADNWGEYIAGTDAEDPDSHLALSVQDNDRAAIIDWWAQAATGDGYAGLDRVYALESISNLPPTAWVPVPGYSNIPGNDRWVSHTNAAPSRTFYRLNVRLE